MAPKSSPVKTAFARWLEALNLTYAGGAEALGLSKSRIVELATGRSRRKVKGSAAPDKRTRLAMRAVKEGLAPWPEE